MYMRQRLWMISSLLRDGGDLASQLRILHGLHSTQKGSLNNIYDFRFLGCLSVVEAYAVEASCNNKSYNVSNHPTVPY